MRTLLSAIIVAAFSLGCGSDSTGPGDDGNGVFAGSLSFNYSGALSGTFSANGSYKQNFDNSLKDGSVTVGFRHPENGQFGVNGYRVTSGGTRGDAMIILFEGTEKGRYTPGPGEECAPRCATVMLYFDVDMAGGNTKAGSGTRIFTFQSGEFNVTELDSKVIKGTFSGTAVEFLGTAEITVTNGTFSAPVIPAMIPAM